MCSGGCCISLFSDAPSSVSILFALAMDGSLDRFADDVLSSGEKQR